MSLQFRFAMAPILSVLTIVATACGSAPASPTPAAPKAAAPAPTSAPAAPAAAPTSAVAPSADATAYAAARQEYETKIVPEAKREGEVTWYTCTTTEEAEARMNLFKKHFPDIKVNYVYMATNEAVERITAEGAANKFIADVYQCGGQSGRTIGWRDLAQPYTPPSAIDPDVKYNFKVMDASGLFPIWIVAPAGILINTSQVPKDKYPATWNDLVTDPYWVDLIKRKRAAYTDPRIPGFGVYLMYGLKEAHAAQYGDRWVNELISFKPAIGQQAQMQPDVERGDLHALIAASARWNAVKTGAPVTTHCPQPGCIATQFFPTITKGAPHPNAAKVWTEFWLTKEAQELFAEWGYAPARADVQAHPERDWSKMPQLYWPDDNAERGTANVLKWVNESGQFTN